MQLKLDAREKINKKCQERKNNQHLHNYERNKV